MRFRDGAADAKSHASSMKLRGKERVEDPVRLLPGSPTPVSLTDTVTCSFSARCDLMASWRVPSTSFIASMPLIIGSSAPAATARDPP